MINNHEALVGVGRIDRTPNPNFDFATMLNGYIEGKQQLMVDGDTKLPKNPSRKALIDFYKKTELFKRTYAEAVRYALDPSVVAIEPALRGDLVGKVFSDMAFIWLRSSLPPEQTILSQRQTLNLWSKMYPRVPEIKHPFGGTSLAGITVPDGVVVERIEGVPKIIQVCEYKASGIRAAREIDYRSYLSDQEVLPDLLGGASFRFFVPEDDSDTKNDSVRRLPLAYSQIRNFIDQVLNVYRLTEDSATISETEKRKSDQLKGIRVVGVNNELAEFVNTPAYRRYRQRAAASSAR